MTKENITILGLIIKSKNDSKQLKMIYNLIKNHPHFQGERRKIYNLLIKYKKFK